MLNKEPNASVQQADELFEINIDFEKLYKNVIVLVLEMWNFEALHEHFDTRGWYLFFFLILILVVI